MDSKLKLGRKVPDKNYMQSLEGREREREKKKKKKKKKGAHSMYALEHNDARSVKPGFHGAVNYCTVSSALKIGTAYCTANLFPWVACFNCTTFSGE